MDFTDNLVQATGDAVAQVLIDAYATCRTPEQAQQLALFAVCSLAGAAGGILVPNLYRPGTDDPADLLDTVADMIRHKVGGCPVEKSVLRRKTGTTLARMVESRELLIEHLNAEILQRRKEISGLLATIHSQAEVIARQEQELEPRVDQEGSGNV